MKNRTHNFWQNLALALGRFLWFSMSELYLGIKHDRIDTIRYVFPGLLLAAFFLFRLDTFILWITDLESLQISLQMREVIVYLSVFSGWIIWSTQRAILRIKFLSRLTDAFTYCGLEANKKLPSFIEDSAIDDYVRNLKLFACGISLKKFQENRENLEGHLNIAIVKITEETGDKSRVNILYAMRDLQSPVVLENLEGFQDGEIPIGISYEGPIVVNMRDVAHILVAGQTGGGKSNFEKIAASVLTINNEHSKVYFLDFKGGMEVADLTNRLEESYKNFQKYEGPKACTTFLAEIGGKIENRLKELAKVGAANFDEYVVRTKKEAHKPQVTDPMDIISHHEDEKRTYIIIDEIAQLYARDPSLSKEEVASARAAVNRIARQGRAAGLHLIVATQKPDSTSFDQTVKSNLPAVVCFPMVSQAASVSALGTKRAFDLNPDIKGRAVWKYGPKTQEVQTYLFQ